MGPPPTSRGLSELPRAVMDAIYDLPEPQRAQLLAALSEAAPSWVS